MDIAARRRRSLDGIGDRTYQNVLLGSVGAGDLHDLNGIAHVDLNDVALLGIGQLIGDLGRERRERHHTQFSAVLRRGGISRVLRRGGSEIAARLERGEQAVGQSGLLRGKHDVAQADRVGSRLGRDGARHNPLVGLQHGTVLLAVEQNSLVGAELSGRRIVIGDGALDILTHERADILGSGELLARGAHLLLQRQHVVIGRFHLEQHVRDRAVRQLSVRVLMLVVILLDLGIRHRYGRIGDRIVLESYQTARAALVGGGHTLLYLQRVGVNASLDDTHEFRHHAVERGLRIQIRPESLILGIGAHLREIRSNHRNVVTARLRIGESVVEDLRRVLAADHGHALGVRDRNTHILESRDKQVLGHQCLPSGVGQSVGLLVRCLRAAVIGLNGLVFVDILRITDLVAVDNAHLGIVIRETHLRSQREDKCQKRQRYDNGKRDAEFGS